MYIKILLLLLLLLLVIILLILLYKYSEKFTSIASKEITSTTSKEIPICNPSIVLTDNINSINYNCPWEMCKFPNETLSYKNHFVIDYMFKMISYPLCVVKKTFAFIDIRMLYKSLSLYKLKFINLKIQDYDLLLGIIINFTTNMINICPKFFSAYETNNIILIYYQIVTSYYTKILDNIYGIGNNYKNIIYDATTYKDGVGTLSIYFINNNTNSYYIGNTDYYENINIDFNNSMYFVKSNIEKLITARKNNKEIRIIFNISSNPKLGVPSSDMDKLINYKDDIISSLNGMIAYYISLHYSVISEYIETGIIPQIGDTIQDINDNIKVYIEMDKGKNDITKLDDWNNDIDYSYEEGPYKSNQSLYNNGYDIDYHYEKGTNTPIPSSNQSLYNNVYDKNYDSTLPVIGGNDYKIYKGKYNDDNMYKDFIQIDMKEGGISNNISGDSSLITSDISDISNRGESNNNLSTSVQISSDIMNSGTVNNKSTNSFFVFDITPGHPLEPGDTLDSIGQMPAKNPLHNIIKPYPEIKQNNPYTKILDNIISKLPKYKNTLIDKLPQYLIDYILDISIIKRIGMINSNNFIEYTLQEEMDGINYVALMLQQEIDGVKKVD